MLPPAHTDHRGSLHCPDMCCCYGSCLSSSRKYGTDVTSLHFLYKLVIKTKDDLMNDHIQPAAATRVRTLWCDRVTSNHRFADVKGWFASFRHFIRFNGEFRSPGRRPEAAERVTPLRSEAGRVRRPAVDMWEAIRFIFPLNHSLVPVTDTEGNVHAPARSPATSFCPFCVVFRVFLRRFCLCLHLTHSHAVPERFRSAKIRPSQLSARHSRPHFYRQN